MKPNWIVSLFGHRRRTSRSWFRAITEASAIIRHISVLRRIDPPSRRLIEEKIKAGRVSNAETITGYQDLEIKQLEVFYDEKDMGVNQTEISPVLLVAADSNARANSADVEKRSAGDFAIPRTMVAASCGVTVERTAESDRAFSVMTRMITACAVGPANGGSPANIS